jgi:hypothetical protein
LELVEHFLGFFSHQTLVCLFFNSEHCPFLIS